MAETTVPPIWHKLFAWLDQDRDRRAAVLSADHFEILRVELWIGGQAVSVATGCDLLEVVTEAMEGMVVR